MNLLWMWMHLMTRHYTYCGVKFFISYIRFKPESPMEIECLKLPKTSDMQNISLCLGDDDNKKEKSRTVLRRLTE